MRRINETTLFVQAPFARAVCLLVIACLGVALVPEARAQQLVLEAALVSSGAGAAEASPVRLDVSVGQPAVGRTGSGAFGVELGFFAVGGMIDVGADDEAGPAAFALDANYPNPFAQSTTIAYALPVAAEVRLEVFDVLGRRVRTLVGAEQAAGRHRVPFETAGLASGVYLYRLTAGARTATRRLQIVR